MAKVRLNYLALALLIIGQIIAGLFAKGVLP